MRGRARFCPKLVSVLVVPHILLRRPGGDLHVGRKPHKPLTVPTASLGFRKEPSCFDAVLEGAPEAGYECPVLRVDLRGELLEGERWFTHISPLQLRFSSPPRSGGRDRARTLRPLRPSPGRARAGLRSPNHCYKHGELGY